MNIDLKSLPNLPGYTVPEFKEWHPRKQTFGLINNQRIEGVQKEKPKFVQAQKATDVWRTGSLPDSTSRSVFAGAGAQAIGNGTTELPAWDALDRHVLRFYGFFKEAVVETNLENYRVRSVTVYYYLEDDTCQIIEPKQDNSGIPQGQLIRRHKFPMPGGGYLKPEDLRVGEDLQVYGRVITLADCDAFTRAYYETIGEEQYAGIPMEADPFTEVRQSLKHKVATQPRSYEKIYREVMLGGGHLNADMQQFLEMDKKVLRFYAILDDVSTPNFERRPFTLMFFLADDKIEIRESYPLNCGRDNFPIFFRKAKMPAGVYRADGPQSQPRKKSEYVDGRDFRVGQDVTLLGNYHFFIYDADEFTRRYFKETLGVELEPPVEVRLPARAVPRAPTPPYNGYGSWDDSLGSVTQLVPKPPRKDFKKQFQNEGKVLRFKAKFSNPKPEDRDRIFVVSFYLQDDTLSIHEPPQRNLGIVTGRFLEKGIHMNQTTNKLFTPNDLLPGSTMKVYNHEFLVLDMDEYSKKMFENPEAHLRSYDLQAVLQKMRESMRQQFPLVRDIFRRFDSDHDGVLTFMEFKKALEKFGFVLSDEEVMQIMQHFDSRNDGQVSYNEFCDALLDSDYTTGMLVTKQPLKPGFDEEYAERALTKTMERAETGNVRKAVRELGDALYKKQGVLGKLFKEMKHMTHEHCVSCEQIQNGLTQVGHLFDLDDIKRAVLFALPGVDLSAVPYLELFKAIVTSFHDLSASR